MRPRPPLELLVFVVGIATLGSEIAVARLIAPFFGDSTIVWANTIAVVLVALSIGYWFGGRLADRHPHLPGLCGLVLASSVLLAVVPIVAQPLLSLSVDAFDDVSIGGFAGSLFGVLALVSIPVLMLGAVSPWAIRLKLERVEDSGETAGRMYAISTVGSLVGTFSASLLLIPLVGTQRTFLVYAILLALVAALGLGRRWMLAPLAVAALLLLPVGVVKAAEEGRVIHEAETTYQYARVIEYPDGRRQLELNEGQAIHSIWRRDTVLTGNYWDGHLTLPFTLRDTPPRKVAMLGVAGGTVARAYAKYFPDTVIDAVEIDGELFDIGKRYFGLRAASAAAAPHRRRAPVPAQDGRALRLHLPRHLPPALHPVLPRHEGVLRAGARPAGAGRRGDHQRRPSRGQLAARARADRDDGRGVPVRDARPGQGHEHAAGRQHDAAVGRAAAQRGARDAAGARPGGADRCAPARPRAARRRGLHRRPRAGRVARRQVAARLRRGDRAVITTGPLGPADLDAVLGVWCACEEHDDGAAEVSRDDLVAMIGRPSFDFARDSVGIREDGALVGFGAQIGTRLTFAFVHPAARGRGLGTWLLGWAEAAARELGARACTQSLSEHGRRRAGAARRARLRAALGGLVLRAGPRGRARAARAPARLRDPAARRRRRAGRLRRDRPRVLASGRTATARASRTGRRPRSGAPASSRRCSRWPCAATRSRARCCWSSSEDEGWVDQLAVAREHRGRGLARALLQHAFGETWRRGLRRAGLSTDSRTGARGLYEHVGMHVRKTYTEFAKPL